METERGKECLRRQFQVLFLVYTRYSELPHCRSTLASVSPMLWRTLIRQCVPELKVLAPLSYHRALARREEHSPLPSCGTNSLLLTSHHQSNLHGFSHSASSGVSLSCITSSGRAGSTMAIRQHLLSGHLFEIEERSFSKRTKRKYLTSASAFSYSAAFIFLIVLTRCHAALLMEA